tara:strand:+ start:612 stop:1355 length:744 start_codon:yes stop_codon:yes gene_type:complete
MITVILNGYRRPHTLKEQYEAIKSQTVKDVDIMFWGNYHEESMNNFPSDVIKNCTSAFCNKNLGVWARFAFALNAYSQYICVMDDDTIPGSKWLENCMNTMKTHRGLLGCRGVRITGDDYLKYPGCQYEVVGLGTHNEEVEEADIMGHCWFFEREWLRAYWAEMPSSPLFFGGEDMHMSYAIQKHWGLLTYVPPHPKNDPEMWGSLSASKYGEDAAATSRTSEGYMQANSYWNHIISQGYSLVKDRK